MKKMLAAIALSGVVAFTAVGCGSDDKKTETAASLTTKASAICARVSTEQNAAAQSQSWDKITPASDKAMKDLRALTPPDDLKDEYNAYLDAQQKVVDATEPLVAALKANDTAKAEQIQTANAALDKATDAAAKAVGIPKCGSSS
jgi:iron uptake system EfeUOB component EfeO/EfeM